MPLPLDLVLTTTEFRNRGFVVSEPLAEVESREYCAHTFEVNGQKAVFRSARTTPKKVGQFVTLWRRTAPDDGPIRPFDASDGLTSLLSVSAAAPRSGGSFSPRLR